MAVLVVDGKGEKPAEGTASWPSAGVALPNVEAMWRPVKQDRRTKGAWFRTGCRLNEKYFLVHVSRDITYTCVTTWKAEP